MNGGLKTVQMSPVDCANPSGQLLKMMTGFALSGVGLPVLGAQPVELPLLPCP